MHKAKKHISNGNNNKDNSHGKKKMSKTNNEVKENVPLIIICLVISKLKIN